MILSCTASISPKYRTPDPCAASAVGNKTLPSRPPLVSPEITRRSRARRPGGTRLAPTNDGGLTIERRAGKLRAVSEKTRSFFGEVAGRERGGGDQCANFACFRLISMIARCTMCKREVKTNTSQKLGLGTHQVGTCCDTARHFF